MFSSYYLSSILIQWCSISVPSNSFLIHFRLIVSFETLFSTLIQSFYKYNFSSHFIAMSSCVNIIHILVLILVLLGSILFFSALFIQFFLVLFGPFWLFSALFGPFRLFSVLFGPFRPFSVISRTGAAPTWA